MKVAIIDGHHQPEVKQNKDQTRTWYEQKAFIDLGGAFPVQFKISLNNITEAFPVGDDYELTPESYKVNQYDNLEIDRWNLKIRRRHAPTF
ncbi:MAG: hypothetical protein JKY01_09030, partial [Pseudomonadales bacterium]|nr:hypothetical protein [Pseudomonadales bacterium]